MKTPNGIRHTAIASATLLTLGMSLPSHADGENTIRAGVFVNPVGVVGAVEYEHLLGNHFSIGARLGYIDYDYKDGTYTETGNGPGVEFLARYYPQGKGHKGFYVGGAVGVWNSTWKSRDPADIPVNDSGTATAADVNVNIGWKIPLGTDRVYLDPNLAIGNFFSLSSSDAANLGFYVAAGLSFGMVF